MSTPLTTQNIVDVIIHLEERVSTNVFGKFLRYLLKNKKYEELDEIYSEYKDSEILSKLERHCLPKTIVKWVRNSNVLVSDGNALFYFANLAKIKPYGSEIIIDEFCTAIAYLVYMGVDESETNSEGKTWREVVSKDVENLVEKELEELKSEETKVKRPKGVN